MARRKDTFKTTKKVAVCAMLAALSFVAMFLGAVSGVFDLCAVVIGAIATAFTVIEIGGIFPWLTASVASVLCLIFLPDKFAALEYVVLGGFYPIFKALFERLPKIASYVIKFAYFNAMLSIALALAKFVFLITDEYVAFSIIVYVIGNAFFIFYDVVMTIFITAYLTRFRQRFKFKI